MTQLSPKIEEAIRSLEDQDAESERVFMTEIAPHLPGVPEPPLMRVMRARELLEPEGLDDLLPQPKRKPGNPNWKPREWHERVLWDDIAEDVRRLKRMGLSPSCANAGAAEYHLRLVRGYCTIDKSYGDNVVDDAELADVIDELHRWTSKGTSGAERRRWRARK